MKTYIKINNNGYGFFICPSMTSHNGSYYGTVYDFANSKFLRHSGALNTTLEVEIWLNKQLKEITSLVD